MSYTKTVWRNNQAPAINADNLNHIEQGIESAHNQMAINTSDIETLTTQVQGNASNIASEISARQSGDSSLQSQIDQLIAPSGEAPSAAEVENARIAASIMGGETYDTLGNAIRGQVTDLKSVINENRSAITSGKSINIVTGMILLEGKLWTGTAGNSIGTDSWAGAVVRNDVLQNFGDCKAHISLSNNLRVKIFEVDIDGTTIRRDSGNMDTSTDYVFDSRYTYAFNFSKVGMASITSADVRAYCSIDIETKINTIESAVSAIVKHNLFDKNTAIPFNYYQGDAETPTLVSNNSWACQLVEVPNDTSYYILNYKDLQIDSYDENKNRIGTEYFTAGTAKKLRAGAKYLGISLLMQHVGDFMLLEADSLPENYVPFGTTLTDGVYKAESEYHIGINDPANNLFYPDGENFTALLKRLKDDDTEKTIYVHTGTYDIFNEYGGTSYISSLTGEETWSEVSVFVPPNTKIIGLGTVILQFKPTAEQIVNDHNAQLFSILNVKHEIYVENLILDGMNCRYCIHDETSGVGDKRGANHTYKNVICIKTQDTYGNGQCFGGGFNDPLNFDFINCKMTSWSIPFSIHNGGDNGYYNKGALINVKDSYFDSTVSSVSMSFRNNIGIQHRDIVNINNTFVGGQWHNIEVTAQGNATYPNSFDITMMQCNEVRGQVAVTPTNIYPIKQINSVDLYDKAITQIKPSWITGYYLSGNSSTYNANASFMYSSPFYIAGHCTLKIFARGYNTVVNILSKTSAKGGYYKEVKRCVDSSASWYSVDIDDAGYYTVCSNKDTNPIIFVTNANQSSNSNMLAMFNKLICCGDSLTYGLVYTSSSTYRQARVPYNEALQKMTGVPTVRYATAGYTAKDWWNANNSHLNEDGLYIIFLGTNGGLTDTINTDCVGNDPSQFADTQTGYYGRILRTLEINKKTAVLIKPPSVNAETQGTIQKFADKYGFAAISIPPDLDNSYYHYAPHNINYSNSVHYNDYGYVRIANCIVEAINNLPLRELFLIAPYELT